MKWKNYLMLRVNLISSISSYRKKLEKSNENFAEFTKSTFGTILQEIFIRPYNQKVRY